MTRSIALIVGVVLAMVVRAGAQEAAPVAASDDKVRVLFVANSYSHWNHLPRLVEEFIRAGQK